jgi:hypothetical protein
MRWRNRQQEVRLVLIGNPMHPAMPSNFSELRRRASTPLTTLFAHSPTHHLTSLRITICFTSHHRHDIAPSHRRVRTKSYSIEIGSGTLADGTVTGAALRYECTYSYHSRLRTRDGRNRAELVGVGPGLQRSRSTLTEPDTHTRYRYQ